MLLLFKVTVTMVHSEDIEDIEKAISDVFPPPPVTEINTNSECICLPYYKCNNQTVISDGTGLIDIRFVKFHELYIYLTYYNIYLM